MSVGVCPILALPFTTVVLYLRAETPLLPLTDFNDVIPNPVNVTSSENQSRLTQQRS